MIARSRLPLAVAALWLVAVAPEPPLFARVVAAGLAFAAPRVLDAVSPADLAVWGLGCVSALDPSLAVTADAHTVRLTVLARPVLARPAPARDDTAAWGLLASDVATAATAASPVLRRAGPAAMTQAFWDEAFARLDPYSRYVPPAPAEAERDRLAIDAAAGIGLVRDRGALAVGDVVPGSPAAAAGVRIGDRLLAIDGVRPRRLAEARARLSGALDTTRQLTLRGLDGITRTETIALAYVPPETVFSHRDDGLAIIRIAAFVANTAERISQAIEAVVAGPAPPAAYVVDLRGNRGGLLRQAVTAVALFAERGVIASTAGRDPAAAHDWRIDGGGDLTGGARLIVLVDGRTASAAEIMAAALADLGRAVVVGSTTLGKGLVQTLTRLPDGGELFVSWSRVLAPDGWPLQDLGVMPQLCTSRGQDETARELAALDDGRAPLAGPVAATRAARAPLPAAVAAELRQPCPTAEGTDADLAAARFLAAHPDAYEAALLHAP